MQAGIDITTNTGAIVVWIGMPIMRSDEFSETARTLNALYKQICDDDPDRLLPGRLRAVLRRQRQVLGVPHRLRRRQRSWCARDDGIHFTPAGGDRVVEAVLEVLREPSTCE